MMDQIEGGVRGHDHPRAQGDGQVAREYETMAREAGLITARLSEKGSVLDNDDNGSRMPHEVKTIGSAL